MKNVRNLEGYTVSQFKDFGLKEELLRAVKEAGFEHPTSGSYFFYSFIFKIV